MEEKNNEKSKQNEFLKDIEKYRKAKQQKPWKGTFLEYTELVEKNPSMVKSAAARIYEMITREGTQTIDNERIRRIFGGPIKSHNFFHDFYGIEKPIEQIVNFFKAAAAGLEESRQILYLMGPVGSGKSSIVARIMEGLTRLDPVYVIDGCPMFEEPLHLLPEGLRGVFEERVFEKSEKKVRIKIEGDLCPVCRHRLKNEFENKYENFPVTTMEFSKRARRGIVSLPPVDPNSQDITELIGAEDIAQLHKYSLGDPRLTLLIGAFNKGNRGIVEFIEIFENEAEYLRSMITATQEKVIAAPGKQSMIYVDLVIIGHSNEPQWNKFKSDDQHEPYLDRLVKVEVPYTMELSEECRIYNKLLSMSKFADANIAPHTFKIAGMLAELSRQTPSQKADPITKLKLYNGDLIIEKGGTKKISVKELKEEAPRTEGKVGLSTRFIIKAIDNALVKSKHNCVNPISVRESLIESIEKGDFPDDKREKFLEFIKDTIHKEYAQILRTELEKIGTHAFKEHAQALFDNYLDHIDAFVNKIKVKDQHEELEPDEEFMSSIEEQLGLTGDAAEGFRQDVISFMYRLQRRKEKINWESYGPLKEAIEKKVVSATSDFIQIAIKSKARDKKELQKYNEIVQRMKAAEYECDHCIEEVLNFARNHCWRD